jgi:hypothetical protein
MEAVFIHGQARAQLDEIRRAAVSVFRCVFSVIYLALILATTLACKSPHPVGYQTYILTEGKEHFSFEYPAHIPIRTVQFSEDGNYIMVDMSGPVSSKDRTSTRIWVTATHTTGTTPNAGLFFQSGLGVAETLEGYRSIERSKIIVAGQEAEQMIYANTLHRSDYETRILHLSPYTAVNRQIYLTHGDAVWTISMTTNEPAYEYELSDFEHILATFTFLA